MKGVESTWWWRRISGAKSVAKFQEWQDVYLVAAYRYELVRRLFPSRKYPPFIKLNRSELEIIRSRLGFGRAPVFIYSAMTAEYPSFARLPAGVWNLEANDNTLKKLFMSLIGAERARRGVARAPTNQGNRNVSPNWNCIVLMDTGTSLSWERARVSQARRDAEKLKPVFLAAWNEIGQHRQFLTRCEKDNPKAAAQAREPVNWSQLLASK